MASDEPVVPDMLQFDSLSVIYESSRLICSIVNNCQDGFIVGNDILAGNLKCPH